MEEDPQKNEEDGVEKELQQIAKDAVKNLKKLIIEGYPREQCEGWLAAVRKKNTRNWRKIYYTVKVWLP